MVIHQATPQPLGLSVGATNLVGVMDEHRTVVRPSEVTLHGRRLTGFVDRIGDPVPLIAPDGSAHRPETLLADALHAVAQAATQGLDATELTVAVPAHWQPAVVAGLRRTLQHQVVSDATAALTALDADPGLPRDGVLVLCDFGGSGTTITLADAADHAVIEAVRFPDFSGDLIDQALLRHVAAALTDADPSGTAMVESLLRLRSDCRGAKERLSAHTATTIAVEVPGHRGDIRITRAELEGLIRGPLAQLLVALDDTMQRRRVAQAALSAVATFGGGARIPLVTQLLSEHLRVPVVTTPQPALTAAHGAALIARRSGVADNETVLASAAGTGVVTTAIDTGAPSSSFGALAWSLDDGSDAGVLFAPAADTEYHRSGSRPDLHFQQDAWQPPEPPRRAPLALFGLAAAAAVISTAVFGVMQLSDDTAAPVEAATTVAPPSAPAAPVDTPAPPAPQAPVLTTVVVQPAQRASPAPRPPVPAPRPAPLATPSAAPHAAATTTAPPTTPTTPPPTPPSTPPTIPPSTPPSTPPSSPRAHRRPHPRRCRPAHPRARRRRRLSRRRTPLRTRPPRHRKPPGERVRTAFVAAFPREVQL
ncbi:Hsp70 family protein [Mycobacterium sp. IDR2000157661]|uniref:Hsp70 family protein n=1 Tax=Mycobacterium sp. IDR2000157661 TaxID=2867005 RepID=UPI001EEB758D|nr:Hsp70 family protein [Mycobacterium sp. IDR2000157661]ULE34350.1 Hsp70 family protein [Mycobacterium sp. IDR2000157661]